MTRVLLFILVFSTQAFAEEFSPKKVYEMLQKNEIVLIDVREKEELKTGLAKGALWFPYEKIRWNTKEWEEFVAKLDKNKPVALYCAAGVRSGWAIMKLRKKGFKTTNVGGFDDWVKAGLPTQAAPE